MNLLLSLAFLFFIGSVGGWVLELFFRRFFSSSNPERKWINPGFCTGPYLPLYGSGLCLLFLISRLERFAPAEHPVLSTVALLLLMAVCMTAIEYLAGILSLKVARVRLWDYSGEWGNIQGIICPIFSLAWAALGALYYFCVHPYILEGLQWLSENLAFSFFIGMFFGVFAVDVAHSADLVLKLKRFAEEHRVVVAFEGIKTYLRDRRQSAGHKYRFFSPFRTDTPLREHLKVLVDTFEKQRRHRKK